jgi:hypothetical protein
MGRFSGDGAKDQSVSLFGNVYSVPESRNQILIKTGKYLKNIFHLDDTVWELT